MPYSPHYGPSGLPDPTRTPAYHNTAAQQHSATPQKKTSGPNNNIIVFDWDDTILPTTWLERQRLLQIGSIRIKPCHARALTALSDSVLSTIEIAANYGKLMIITNAAPGWVEASCQQFMPALLPFIKSVPLYARPFNALMTTWKLDAFARECGGGEVEGVVSLGDGPIERQACLRLMAEDKRVKSVKFKESPSISQLVSEHELLHLRLKDLLKHDSDLDLRLLCNNTNPQAGNGGRPPCSIVHISKLDKTATTASSSPPVTLPRIPQAARTITATTGELGAASTTTTKGPDDRATPRTINHAQEDFHLPQVWTVTLRAMALLLEPTHHTAAHILRHFDDDLAVMMHEMTTKTMIMLVIIMEPTALEERQQLQSEGAAVGDISDRLDRASTSSLILISYALDENTSSLYY
ncbi:hypothetical protein FOL46_006940 [Perkinsus olseni]|uniref:Uncharacterized protein n=1 Tax=Perkinsus olseni TaxID=32597 RepID=A0A7J6LGV6_PEROL|nr:hypothetical protein FOL46_006940 [Perkinsus olseni]